MFAGFRSGSFSIPASDLALTVNSSPEIPSALLASAIPSPLYTILSIYPFSGSRSTLYVSVNLIPFDGSSPSAIASTLGSTVLMSIAPG